MQSPLPPSVNQESPASQGSAASITLSHGVSRDRSPFHSPWTDNPLSQSQSSARSPDASPAGAGKEDSRHSIPEREALVEQRSEDADMSDGSDTRPEGSSENSSGSGGGGMTAGPAVIMPTAYENCRVPDLVSVIASMLNELCEANHAISLHTTSLTRFHSRSPPALSIKDYLGRLAKHAGLTPPILLTMVFLIDRLCEHYSTFQLNALTVHRYLIAAATVSCKGLSDAFMTNELYARIGGIKVRELAILELELLWRVDWRIVPQPSQLTTYYRSIVERCPGYVLESAGREVSAQGMIISE